MSNFEKIHYVYSCDLDEFIQIKIGTLEGERHRPSYRKLVEDPMLWFSGVCEAGCADLCVTCQVYSDDHSITLPVQTSYKAFFNRWSWNEWLTLPIKYSECPRDAQLAFTVWDIYSANRVTPVGGATLSLFNKQGQLRKGMYDLRLWPEVEAGSKGTTPGKESSKLDPISHLNKLCRARQDGQLPEVEWLDRLALREVALQKEKQKKENNEIYLMIEFPDIKHEKIEYSVIYFETGADETHYVQQYPDVVTIVDAEIGLENLVESKHHKLARRLRSGPTDRELKPNTATRDRLNTIVKYPPTKPLSSEEKDLVWKFRYYLQGQNEALTKFLKSVNWSMEAEVRQALELMEEWQPPGAADALELLSPAYTHPTVRKYSVVQLEKADDEELLQYLLQLVQSLRYENYEEICAACDRECTEVVNHPTSLEPSTSYRPRSSSDIRVDDDVDQLAVTLDQQQLLDDALEEVLDLHLDSQQMDLTTFLLSRAANNDVLCSYLFWYLVVECEDLKIKDPKVHTVYAAVLRRLNFKLIKGGVDGQRRRNSISKQQQLMDRLKELVAAVSRESGHRQKKIEKLQSLLQTPDQHRFRFDSFEPIPLPLDPEVSVWGIDPATATLFKSALMPCRLSFLTTTGTEYITIFKTGDDLRQDQLVLQIITLMDRLLRRENLDLRLTPYKVLATSTKDGFVQFIDSQAVAEIVKKYGSIVNFFKEQGRCDTDPIGFSSEIMDNFVRSCAGYCIITYILGVGDRHLDNLLVTKSGKLFHIDFGFILGRDPKPMPTPMKLSKEIIEVMGGQNSEHFVNFKKHCYTAFLALRRSAGVLLNLFSLMVDANIPDIALEPDKTVQKVQEKLCLDQTDEEAVKYIQGVIDVSTSATVAVFMEKMHELAQYWRK